ncbi:3-deoxy-D-manno-octulosonate 8-phosphate phosphatase [Mucilaginibacter pallidiroseus]|uniref:3-deoxy-D-manno-octulosonate 8-phosphate phosphatase n=1 Tax=Mucilaginibacter pallidiroseus TaxID=2599295 RepID=A0A563UCQ1_9SPHI|nr:HAD hydrolase family protein [Mucilaginibacter pallidiroseus]TWR29049.1 3-deoxy-D-manno-octulosonate 8-phosphate phosphatase [Mucilaginibacter pallidiroseus]
MESFFSKLKDITTFIFDVDGVLTDGSVFVTEAGVQSRAFNIKDGYALQLAVKSGYNVAAISGSRSKSALFRLNSLGIYDVYLGTNTKVDRLKLFMEEKSIHPSTILYMADDIPDLAAMQMIGLPVCPADAAEEIKAICTYVSPIPGGRGCAREIIEKVMKVQGTWLNEQAYSW